MIHVLRSASLGSWLLGATTLLVATIAPQADPIAPAHLSSVSKHPADTPKHRSGRTSVRSRHVEAKPQKAAADNRQPAPLLPVPQPVQADAAPSAVPSAGAQRQVGPVTLTPGGFLELGTMGR